MDNHCAMWDRPSKCTSDTKKWACAFYKEPEPSYPPYKQNTGKTCHIKIRVPEIEMHREVAKGYLTFGRRGRAIGS